MRVLLVQAHPRAGSLTGAVADALAAGLAESGHAVERADLMAEGFQPVLAAAEEPDWTDPARPLPPDVRAEIARIERNEATVLVFPVWWWTMPAVMKGWIDRVWAHGWAYGGARYPHDRVWALGLVGNPEAEMRAGGYAEAMRVMIEDGTLRYCGVPEPRLILLADTLTGPDRAAAAVAASRDLGRGF